MTEDYGLATIENMDLQTVKDTMNKIALFQAVIQATLKVDHDYGVIQGTNKPTLLKPGAEKIFRLMGLTTEYEIIKDVEDWENGFFAYMVRAIVSKNGYLITHGLGNANTKEARYANRWVTKAKLPAIVDSTRLEKREKPSKFGSGTYTEYLVENDDPYTLANTVLKMAKKRAQVDAALTVASLSDIFSQDLEDLAHLLPVEEVAKVEPAKKEGKATKAAEKVSNQTQEVEAARIALFGIAKELGFAPEEVKSELKKKYKTESTQKLSKDQLVALTKDLEAKHQQIIDEEIGATSKLEKELEGFDPVF